MLALLLLPAIGRAQTSNLVWSGAVSSEWNNPSNWIPNRIPGLGDFAVITNPTTVYLTDSATVGKLMLRTGASLDLSNQTLIVSHALVVGEGGSFTVASGALVGAPAAMLMGTIGWTGGSLEGALEITTNGILNIEGGDVFLQGCILTNNGTVNWSGGTLHGGGGTRVINVGTWEMGSDQTWDNALGGPDELDNYGVVSKTGGAGSTYFQGVVYYQFAGEITVGAGLDLELQGGGGLYGGTIATNLIGRVSLSGGTFNLEGTMTETNTVENGASWFSDNVIEGGLTWTAGVWDSSGSVTISSNSVLVFAGGSGTLDIAACDVTNYGTVLWQSGTLQGGLGGYIENDGTWEAASDQTINSADGGPAELFENNGVLLKTGGGGGGNGGGGTIFQVMFNQGAGFMGAQAGTGIFLEGGGSLTGGGLGANLNAISPFTNMTGLVSLAAGQFTLDGVVAGTNTWEAGADLVGTNVLYGTLSWSSGSWQEATSVTVAIGATLLANAGGGTNYLDCPFTNYGIFDWAGGGLQGSSIIVNDGVWEVPNGATLTGMSAVIENAGILRKTTGTNAGTIAVVLQSRGGVMEADEGILSLAYSLYEQGTGTLTLGLTGTNTGQWGQLEANIVFLGGPLNLEIGAGFTPAPGSQYPIVSSPNLYGAFTSANLPAGLSLVYTNNAVLLVATNTLSGPVLTWPTPASIVYGTVLGPSQFDAQASQPGNFTYNLGEGVLLGAGMHELFVIYIPALPGFPPVTNAVSLLVIPAPLMVSANSFLIQPGSPIPALTVSYSGFVAGDTAASLGGVPVLTTTATPQSLAGTYPINISQGTINDPNYTYTFVPGVLTIEQTDFYVATNGNDANPGTLSQPFQTLLAAELAEEAVGTNVHRNIYLRGGEYFNVCQYLEGPGTAGADDSDITFAGYSNETAILYGGQPLTGWTPLSNGLWEAALPAYPAFNPIVNQLSNWEVRMLLVDGQMATRAQFPIDGSSLTYTNDTTQTNYSYINYNPGDIPATMVATNMEVMLDFSWDAETMGVTSVDPVSRAINFSGGGVRSDRGLDYTGIQTYRVYNTAEGLSRPGQFYFDRGRHVVVYWPLNGADPNNSEIIAPTTDCMFYISGYLGASPRNITFSNLTLKVSAVDIENEYNYGGGWDHESLIRAFYCTNLVMANLTMGWCGGNALGMEYGYCTNAILVNSEIGFCGGYGACLRMAPCLISNNFIHDTGLISWQSPAVRVSQNALVIQNDIFNSKETAVGDHDMDACTITLNNISNAMTVLRDMGAIYTYFGGDMMTHTNGNIICSNLFQHVNPPVVGDGSDPRDYFQPAVYFDELTSNSVVRGNVFLDCNIPFFCNVATSNAITGNVCVNSNALYLRIYASPDSSPPNQMQGNVFVSNTNFVVDNPDVWNTWADNLFWSAATPPETNGVPPGAVIADPQFTGLPFNFGSSSPAPSLGISPLVWELLDPGVSFVTAQFALLPTPVITWANPADIVYGTALGASQLNATATYNSTNVPGAFTYTPAAGAILNAGSGQTLAVIFTPTDTSTFRAVTAYATLNVAQAVTTGAIVSSANPALPGANVTFTMTVSPVPPGASVPGGTVNFRINGIIESSITFSGGVAAFATDALPHGSNTVVAEYSGDQNFLGITNSLAPAQVINTPPVAGNFTIQRYPAQGAEISLTTILAGCSDADGDSLAITVSSTSANGGAITISNGLVIYSPAPGFTNADSFTYTVADGYGGSAVGNIEVVTFAGQNLTITSLGNGSYLISGNGIPNYTYTLQYSATINPANWQNIPGASMTADGTGAFQYTGTPSGGTGFYRTVYP